MERVHEVKNVDLQSCNRPVWLVKVPNYVSEAWERSGTSEAGKIEIVSEPNQKPSILFNLNEQAAKASAASTSRRSIPLKHRFYLTPLTGSQHFYLFAERKDGKTAAVGKVAFRAECRPFVDDGYLNLKKQEIARRNEPTKSIVQLSDIVRSYRPISEHAAHIESERKRKEEGKRLRADKDKVQEMLFQAFEKHQYYNIKDLVNITEQPVSYLKEILNEICIYNVKQPHKSMWELKPEFRHYGSTGSNSMETS